MAGYFHSSRLVIVALSVACTAVAAQAVAHLTVSVSRVQTAVTSWLYEFVVWRLPRLAAGCVRPDLAVRVKKDGTIGMRTLPKRRPQISTRWRFAPSV